MHRSRLPSWALSAFATLLLCGLAAPAGSGATASQRELQLYVALEPRDPAALERFATAVSTPGSPLYGQYLEVPEFARRFGATPEQVTTVRSALGARGLDVGAAAANRLSLPVNATVEEAESAFDLSIDPVRLTSGRVAYANDRAPAIPASAAPYVQGVLGLDNLSLPQHRAAHHESSAVSPSVVAPTTLLATGAPQPCPTAEQLQGDGYTADQIASAYGFSDFYSAGNFGAGQTVALLELEPYLPSDIETFQSCYGTDVEITNVDVNGGPGPYEGEDGEAALDLEQLIGLAPGANVVVYQAPNGGGAEAEILSAYVQQNLAKVMSSSWGICEREIDNAQAAAVGTLLQEAAAQGQSFFVAAGDEGSTDCYEEEGDHDKTLAVDYPGSDPFATDVGGTRMENPTATTSTEYLWNESPHWGAGGGGVSEHFPMPSYQQGAAPNVGVIGELSSGVTCGFAGYCRQVPDVAADASLETGYVVYSEGEWGVAGGTSAAAPLWAALATLTNASATCQGHTIGFANPALYEVAGEAYAANFHDVTEARPGGMPTTNRFGSDKPFPAEEGYDMATGLGTPNGPALATSLCALVAPVPGPPAPSTGSAAANSTAVATPAATPQLLRASLGGVQRGRPKLRFTIAARAGSRLRSVAIDLPPGLAAEPERLRIRVAQPRSVASFEIAFPALTVTPGLVANVNNGRVRTRELLVATRESRGVGARLSAVLPLRRD